MSPTFWLTNVRLESGFCRLNGAVVGTEIKLCHLKIENGRIAEIVSATQPLESDLMRCDAHNLLLLPSFREMHIHLDKTYYGGPWKACSPFVDIFTRIHEEERLLPGLLPTAQERAEAMIGLVLGYGATHIRTHCNVDPVIGTKNLEATRKALATYKGKISHEIVAFPQHGLLRSDSVGLMREALANGASIVGGVDPATVDENIEASLHALMQLAVDFNKDIDLHLHDGGQLGAYTIRRLAALAREAGWQGRVTISHAFALADLSAGEASGMAELLAETGIRLTSTVPIDMPTIPIPLLHDLGVAIAFGNDSITDHWDPFGTGDVLHKARIFAERFGWIDERSLAKALGFITGGKTPLDQEGNQVWPRVGDEANMVLVNASCSAEAVARKAKRTAVFFQGNIVAGVLEEGRSE